jgi:hypothetical protein
MEADAPPKLPKAVKAGLERTARRPPKCEARGGRLAQKNLKATTNIKKREISKKQQKKTPQLYESYGVLYFGNLFRAMPKN